MVIRPEEISSIIRKQIESYGIAPVEGEAGGVISVGDGIARVYGLRDCMSGELLRFGNGTYGMAVNLEEDNIGCVLLGDDQGLKEGSMAYRTKAEATVPVGDAVIGRVVAPLGEPLDGKGEIACSGRRPVEFPAPSVNDRESVTVPLQ
ncbi:MAG: F0F1 ATP synthase subunit alpha, partial [Clostridiales bacterium]|nr:F0F1 ATP synthase subunit alpha [Clostridiales bacterium]